MADDWARAYVCAHFGKSLFWYMGEVFLTFFLIGMLDIDPVHISTYLALGLGLSAILDLAIGRLCQTWLHQPRFAGRIQSIGALGCATSFGTILVSGYVTHAPAGIVAGILMFRIAFELYDVGQETLLSIVPTLDPGRRRGIVGLRLAGSAIASMLISVMTGYFATPGRNTGAALHLAAIAIAISTTAILTALVLERRSTTHPPRGPSSPWSPPTAVAPTPQSPAHLRQALSIQCVAIFVSAWTAPYFVRIFPFILHAAPAIPTWILACLPVGATISQPLWHRMIGRVGEAKGIVTGCAASCAALAGMALLADPPRHDDYAVLAVLIFLLGVANGGVALGLWTHFVETAAAARHTSRYYGTFMAVSKVGLAAMSVLLGEQIGTDGRGPSLPVFCLTATCALLAIGACALLLPRAATDRTIAQDTGPRDIAPHRTSGHL